MQFVTSRIKTTSVSVGDAVSGEKKASRTLDQILDDMKGQKQVKTAQCNSPVGGEVEKSCVTAEPAGQVEDAACGGPAVETACSNMAAPADELEVAAVSPLTDEESLGLLGKDPNDPNNPNPNDPNKRESAPLFASNKPMILKVAKKADFRPWNPEEIIKAWNGYGSQEKCVVASKNLTNDPKAYCFLLQTASEEATKLLKTASAKPEGEKKVASPKAMFKKIASLSEKDRSKLYEYWKTMYGEQYANAMLEDYVK